MNILVLNWRDMSHPEAGGAEVHFQELFSRFAKNGHTVILLTTRFKGCAPQITQDGIIVYRWGHTYLFNWEAPFLVRRVMKRHAVDCIIDDVNKLPFFTPAWFPNIPCGVIFHHLFGSTVFSLAFYPLALYVLCMERMSVWAYKKTPCCTVSQSTARELVESGLSRESITIIENSVDTNRYSPDPSVRKEKNLLMYAGRLKKYKNVELVLDAVKAMNGSGRRIRLMIAGAGDDEKDLRLQARRLCIEQSVEFCGYVDETEKISLYRRASVFVNPSRKEGWGITNIEAGACGTAVVANDVPGLRDSVKNGETGLLYRQNDVTDCIRCITEILDNDALREKYETGGRKWALGFSWDESSAKMERWISGVVCAK
jgi:glycosyltransferase involved in cell wall biosynthesis